MPSTYAHLDALRALSTRELLARRDRIEHDPECRTHPSDRAPYTPDARRELAAIEVALLIRGAEVRVARRAARRGENAKGAKP